MKRLCIGKLRTGGKTNYGERDLLGVSGDWVGVRTFWNLREISWKSPSIKSGVVKRQVQIFTIGPCRSEGELSWDIHCTSMAHPPIENLKMHNFPQLQPFPEPFKYAQILEIFCLNIRTPIVFKSIGTSCKLTTTALVMFYICIYVTSFYA